jgi:Rrf2 family protein
VIKLNRTTEYGLIALRHMSRKGGVDSSVAAGTAPVEVTSAREIADHYGLPFEITAKTLQRLKDTGLIHSAQGAKGGYALTKALGDVSLGQFLEMMEGPQGLVACVGEAPSCEYHNRCEMKGLLADIDGRVKRFLSGIRLEEITSERKA